ncbi:hypothetical protein WA026_009157 [Henosepilachna vigintioctopunctata]|uniref:Uncharacterized protein n=1 Tax=Henosepilachna vigintioctopunctata TaxID=420089 RepID=A0AAW1UQV5_9CUCU
MSLAICWCWRKRSSDTDLTGVNGHVITRDPEDNIVDSHATSSTLPGVTVSEDNECKKEILLTNPRRSLPDIPLEHNKVDWEPGVDNSSEHYATLEQYENSLKRISLVNNIEARVSTSQHTSVKKVNSSPYESVKYDKLNLHEHPYAQLQPTQSRSQSHDDGNIDEPGTSQRPESCSSNNEHVLDIPAASAVSGGIAASSELPYMTPPIPQTNFSGDSQDSSKGYTSISVREPIANIVVQTVDVQKKRELDPHYSTVSDDSDDVYTTIPDACDGANVESEIYRRRPPGPILNEAGISQCTPRVTNDGNHEIVHEVTSHPLPPTVDSLKHVTHAQIETHSRQASSSSSNGNFGSPKPERRQANSPLPPPPLLTDGSMSTLRDIDDLYAKVQKNKPRTSFEETKSINNKSDSLLSREFPLVYGTNDEMREMVGEHSYETLRKLKSNNNDELEKNNQEEPSYASIKGPDSIASSDPGYEVLRENLNINAKYDQLKNNSNVDNLTEVENSEGILDNKNDARQANFELNTISEYRIGESIYNNENDPGYEAIGNSSDHYEHLDCATMLPNDEGNKLNVGNIEDSNHKQVSCKCIKDILFHETSANTSRVLDKECNNITSISNSLECAQVEKSSEIKRYCKCGHSDNNVDILDEDVIFQV